jgi:hypothetical protein
MAALDAPVVVLPASYLEAAKLKDIDPVVTVGIELNRFRVGQQDRMRLPLVAQCIAQAMERLPQIGTRAFRRSFRPEEGVK